MVKQLGDIVSFHYPVTRPYNAWWRYATPFLISFVALGISGLSVLNFYLVGYDVVNINSNNFNDTRGFSWYQRWRMGSDGCQAHMFQLGDTFRTNISAFTYQIYDIRPNNTGGVEGGISYANNTLSDCDVSQVQVTVSPGDHQVSLQAAIDCVERGFQASTSYTYPNGLVIGTLPVASFAKDTFARAILDQMNYFGTDAYGPIYNTLYTAGTSTATEQLFKVQATFVPYCSLDALDSQADCDRDNPTSWNLTDYDAISQVSLAIVADAKNYPDVVHASLDSLSNYVKVFYYSVRLDLGHWTENNIFTSRTALDDTLVIPPDVKDSWAAWVLRKNKPLAYVNHTTPPPATIPSPPAVAQIQYVCNTRQLKSPGSLFISVTSSTMSMFITAWGLLTMVMATFARRYPGANVCAVCDARVVGEEMDCDLADKRSESTLLTSFVPDIEKFQNVSKIDY